MWIPLEYCWEDFFWHTISNFWKLLSYIYVPPK
jgi:hypothetical protein